MPKNQVAVQTTKQIPKVIGKHVYANLYDIDSGLIANLDRLTTVVIKAAQVGNMHILELVTKKFSSLNGVEGGVSVIALIEESHIALHTWPESMYATVDIYTCGAKSNAELALKYVIDELKPKSCKIGKADRGN